MNLHSGLERVFAKKTENIAVQFFRYTLVGGAAFILDFFTLWFLTDIFSVHYLASAALAFLVGLTTNYLLSIAWVFNSRSMGNRSAEFIIFALIGIVGLGLNEVLMWALTGLAGFHYLLSKLGSTVVVYLWNFFARRFLLFTKSDKTPDTRRAYG